MGATLLYPWLSLCACVQLRSARRVGWWAAGDLGWRVGGGLESLAAECDQEKAFFQSSHRNDV